MEDVVLVTADSIRYDFVGVMDFISSFDPILGITAGHYTRPSLASLHSSSLLGSVRSKVVSPSIAEVLSEHGYTCIGLASTAQADPTFNFDAGFDHYDNFMEGGGSPVANRRSPIREYLGRFDLVREIYQRLYPMEAILSGLPPDDEIVDQAITLFNSASSPRFLWVHLMETHRPYGRGENALPRAIDRKAEAAGRSSLFTPGRITSEEEETIKSTYRSALSRTDDLIERFLKGLEGDPNFVFTSDHGDEFGEEGYYYHQGYRRRVVDSIIQVPVVMNGFEIEVEHLSLLDIGTTIIGSLDLPIPEKWHGNNLLDEATEETITIAPWHEKATVAWQNFETKLVAEDAAVSISRAGNRVEVERGVASPEVERRLRNLGYNDVG